MPEHHLITDPHLHEPKGASTASEGMFYVSDGNGSGEWRTWPLGAGYYQHSGTGQTITSTPSKLLVDGLGPRTREGYLPREIRGGGTFWNHLNSRIQLIRLGDSYSVNIYLPLLDLIGDPTELYIDLHVGSDSPPGPVLSKTTHPLTGTGPFEICFSTTFMALTQNMVNEGAEPFLSVDTGSAEIGEAQIHITKIADGVL